MTNESITIDLPINKENHNQIFVIYLCSQLEIVEDDVVEGLWVGKAIEAEDRCGRHDGANDHLRSEERRVGKECLL